MTASPWRNVVIAGVYNTRQARVLEGETTESIQLKACLGMLELAGLERRAIDGMAGGSAGHLAYRLGLGPVWASTEAMGIPGLFDAANAIAVGLATSVLVVGGAAGILATAGDATAPWVRSTSEFIQSTGIYTAAEFALTARRHMELFGTTPEQLATVSATIRNNGHINPEAVYFDRGPYTVQDVLDSRMVADPFHLLDCSMTAEGACALLVTTRDRAADLRLKPVHLLGGGLDFYAPSYAHAPAWDLRSYGGGDDCLGTVGRRAAMAAYRMGDCTPDEIDVCELYDPFSFEVLRQFEAFGFCELGEGGDFVMAGNMAPDGPLPTNTDGGLLSYSHNLTGQTHQRIGRCVQQLQGACRSNQLDAPRLALASNGGAGASWCHVALLGTDLP